MAAGDIRKIALLAGTDDLSPANYGPLMAVLRELAREVIVLVADASVRPSFEGLGGTVVEFDCRATLVRRAHDAVKAWQLARILEAEGVDAVHAKGVRAAVLCGLALRLIGGSRAMVHLPDLSAVETSARGLPRLYGRPPAKVIAAIVRRTSTFLLVDSAADLAAMRALGIDPGARAAVVGGPGIDPDAFPLLPPVQTDMPVAACPLPLANSSGVDVLLRAFDRVWARGVRMELELAGRQTDEPDAIPGDDLTRWGLHPGIRRIAPVADVREVWRGAEICVLPAVTRQGLPRALLEAAACGRALVVTDCVAGGFVRHEAEGLIVPAGDVAALAEALERLARDRDLRLRLGRAARFRIPPAHTDAHVRQTLRSAYLALLDTRNEPGGS